MMSLLYGITVYSAYTCLKYYQNLIAEHKSNMKKTWQIIKMIINKRKYNPVCKNVSAIMK